MGPQWLTIQADVFRLETLRTSLWKNLWLHINLAERRVCIYNAFNYRGSQHSKTSLMSGKPCKRPRPNLMAKSGSKWSVMNCRLRDERLKILSKSRLTHVLQTRRTRVFSPHDGQHFTRLRFCPTSSFENLHLNLLLLITVVFSFVGDLMSEHKY